MKHEKTGFTPLFHASQAYDVIKFKYWIYPGQRTILLAERKSLRAAAKEMQQRRSSDETTDIPADGAETCDT